ncbi:MAG: hypothetical protein HZB26_08065 [Candidatus Hydrogenedentes bacterium]|nr:hypothetical protein [Candidatus Hydrogenedentota bacterium]
MNESVGSARWGKLMVVLGALWWVMFSALAVVLRGVRWDDSYEYAQVLLNLIHYPDGHPMLLNSRNSFCLQTYITAAIMWILPGPSAACGFRNVLYILSGTLPAYLLGSLVSRRAIAGHAAALLAFMLAPGFTDAYPTESWPILSGYGVIGLGFALCTLCFVAIDRPGAAFFMVGLMPAIHLGQFPPILVIACLYAADACWRGRRDVVRSALAGGCAGLAVTGGSLLILLFVSVAPPVSGPYSSSIPWIAVWQGYLAHFNYHRILHVGIDQLVLFWAVLLGSVLIIVERRRSICGPGSWLGIYGWAIALIVWGAMAIHCYLGNQMPPSLLAWMPYRLPNHLAPLLVALMASLLTTVRSAPGLGLLLVPAIVCAGLGIDKKTIFLVLCGATVHAVFVMTREDRWVARLWLLACVTGCYGLSRTLGDYYALVALGGWLAAVAAAWADRMAGYRRWTEAYSLWLTGIAVLVTATGLLYGQWQHRADAPQELLTINPFEEEVTSYLYDRNEQDAMIAVPPLQVRSQERLNHPVTGDASTIPWVPYHKSVAPIIAKFFKDLYGIDLTRPPGKISTLDFSLILKYGDVWRRRSVQEWQTIGGEYGFRYVIMLSDVPLQLPVAVDGSPFRMYAIPAKDGS